LLGRATVPEGLVRRTLNFGNYVAGDLYFPTNADKTGRKLPVVLWLHPMSTSHGYGAGYKRGENPHLALARTGCAVFAFDQIGHGTRLSEVLGHIDRLSERFGLPVANVFHAGDGNLHPLVCYDAANPGEAHRAEELAGLIIDACLGVGGSITGEHGVGVDKKASMTKMFSEADLDAFQRLRCAFDPTQLANPGKVMPAPRLCGEVPGPYRQHPIEAAGLGSRL